LSFSLEDFSAFGLPRLPVLRFAEIDAEFPRDLFKRKFRIVKSVGAKIREHLDLFKVEARCVRLWSCHHSWILPPVETESRPLIFLNRLPDGKFNVAEDLHYLYFEVVQPNSQRTAATFAIMELLAAFFPVVVIQ
jgi:hypothetical protein